MYMKRSYFGGNRVIHSHFEMVDKKATKDKTKVVGNSDESCEQLVDLSIVPPRNTRFQLAPTTTIWSNRSGGGRSVVCSNFGRLPELHWLVFVPRPSLTSTRLPFAGIRPMSQVTILKVWSGLAPTNLAHTQDGEESANPFYEHPKYGLLHGFLLKQGGFRKWLNL